MARRTPATALPKGPNGGVQLLLTKDVPHLGRAGDLVEVRPGYARNYLLPYGFAAPATPENVRRVEKYKAELARREAERKRRLQEMARQLENMEIHVEAAANELGHLYGSVGPTEIAQALKMHEIDVTEEMVKLEGVIKQTGLYTVKIQLAEDIAAEISLWVVPLGDMEG